ncbi:MAG: tetratricopeptide repeat protein [Myxococcales bacterium]|nr:tetratricopeptide repeat protein [Myxococcales bacterium]
MPSLPPPPPPRSRRDGTLEVLLDELSDAPSPDRVMPPRHAVQIPEEQGSIDRRARADSVDAVLDDLDLEPAAEPVREASAASSAPQARRAAMPHASVPVTPRAGRGVDPGGRARAVPPPPTRGGLGSPPRPTPAAEPPAAVPRVPPAVQATIRALEAELSRETEPARQVRLHHELGRLYETWLRDTRKALHHHQEALARNPDHLPSVRAARRLLVARRAWAQALALFDTEIRLSAEPRRKAVLYWMKGRIQEDALSARDEARKCYLAASELDRADVSWLSALAMLDRDRQAWADVERWLERQASAVAADPRHRIALLLESARILEHRLRDLDGAVARYEAVVEIDPAHPGALAALRRLLPAQRRGRELVRVLEAEARRTPDLAWRAAVLVRAARLTAERPGALREATALLEEAARAAPTDPLVLSELVRAYEQGGRPEATSAALERLLAASTDAAERLAVLRRLAELALDPLGDEQAAVRWYEAALALAPDHEPVVSALCALYARRDDHEAVVRARLAQAAATTDAAMRAEALATAAHVCERHLGRVDEAIELHRRALAAVPGHPVSFAALLRLLGTVGRHAERVELFERAAAAESDPVRAAGWLMQAGVVLEDVLGDASQALHAYRRALALDAGSLAALHAVQRAAERARRWPELVEALEREVERLGSDPRAVALLCRAAAVTADELHDRDGAIARYRRALARDPKASAALAGLADLYQRAGRWEALLEIAERQLEIMPRGPASAALLVRMAAVHEQRLGQPNEAIALYERALEHDTRHRPALRALERLRRERGQWAELARLLETEMAGATDPEHRAAAAVRVAEVHEERLGQPERAIAAYETALRARPGWRPALDALARLRAERRAYAKLVEEIATLAADAADPDAARAARLWQAELWAHALDEPRRAVGVLESVLEADPDCIEALVALEPLQRKLGQWEGLGRTYAELARRLGEPGGRVAALRELVRLQEARGVPAGSDPRESWEALLALCPDDLAALEALERVALDRGDAALLASVDARLAAISTDPALVAAARTRQGEVLETIDPARALEAFDAALEADPESIAAVHGLVRIAEALDDPVRMAEAARRQAAVARDPVEVAAALVRSARLRTDRLGDAGGALEDAARALEVHPDSADAATLLDELLSATGSWDRLADRLARAAASATTTERSAALWLRVAEIQAGPLGNVPAAIASLHRLVRAVPHHVPALARLAELYVQDGQWNEAASLLGRVVQLSQDRGTLRDAHLRLASIWEQRLGDTARAMVSLQAVLSLDPAHPEALARLASVHEREGRLEQAAEALARLVRVVGDPRERVPALRRLARLELGRGAAHAARQALLEAIALEGPSGEAAHTFVEAFASPADVEAFADAVETYAAGVAADEAVEAHLEVARLRADVLGQPERALEGLRVASAGRLEGEPRLRLAIAERLRLAGRHEQAASELLALVRDDPAIVEGWRALARAFEAMGRHGEARLALEPLLVLGAATDAERQLVASSPRPTATPGSFDAEALVRFAVQGGAELAACQMLAGLVEAYGKLYPPDFEAFGVGARDRLGTRTAHPLRRLADGLAAVHGEVVFDLYVHRMRGRGVAVELSEPPSLLVPQSVAELPEAQQRFVLARPIAAIAMRLAAAEKLTARELEVLLASAARLVSPQAGKGLTAEDFLDEQQRRIRRALSRRMLRWVEEAAARYVAAGRVDVARLHEALGRACRRVALLLADDLQAVVDLVRRTGEWASVEPAVLVREHPVVGDLARFWMSEPAMQLRRRMGLLAA